MLYALRIDYKTQEDAMVLLSSWGEKGQNKVIKKKFI
jgi:hypothetical protein